MKFLNHATKQNLNAIKGQLGRNVGKINDQCSQAALLKDAEPVAASDQAFVIKFKYEIHCQMAMDNNSLLKQFSMVIRIYWKKTAGGWCS